MTRRVGLGFAFVCCAVLAQEAAHAEFHIYRADHETGEVVKFAEDGTKLWSFPNNKSHDVQVLGNGNVVINPGIVQEVTPGKEVVWRYELPLPHLAQRLESGNTLISSGAGGGQKGYFLIEVDPAGKTVWKYGGDEAPANEQLNWPSGFVRLPDGTIYVSECRSARICAITPDRKSFGFITSPAMKHAATSAVVEAGTAYSP